MKPLVMWETARVSNCNQVSFCKANRFVSAAATIPWDRVHVDWNVMVFLSKVQDILDPHEVEVFPAFTHTVRGNFVLHGLIRLAQEKWPDRDLINKLRSLSPAVMIKVDPDTLL